MAEPRTDVLVQLAAARSAIDSAISLLAGPHIAMPAGVERPQGPCTHPNATAGFGGWKICPDCDAKWQDVRGEP